MLAFLSDPFSSKQRVAGSNPAGIANNFNFLLIAKNMGGRIGGQIRHGSLP
jgi:hypothetical protein